jgi:hypothetical protein
MRCKTIACGRYALATARVLDRPIGCSSPPASAKRRTVFSASSRLLIRVHRRTTVTMSSQNERGIEASGEKYQPSRNSRPLFKLACSSRYSIFLRRRCATPRAIDSGDIWSHRKRLPGQRRPALFHTRHNPELSRLLHRSDYLHFSSGTASLWEVTAWAPFSVWRSRQLDIRR